jgi:hypothetical protein
MSGYVLGIDPGAREVGVVLRRGTDVVRAKVLDLPAGAGGWALRDLCEEIEEVIHWPLDAWLLVAVEAVKAPNPHMNRRLGGASAVINVGSLLTTAAVWGAVMVWKWEETCGLMSVPPAGHGSKLLAAYPPELVTARERAHGLNRVGGGRYRHLRSGYDIAGAAALMARAGAA